MVIPCIVIIGIITVCYGGIHLHTYYAWRKYTQMEHNNLDISASIGCKDAESLLTNTLSEDGVYIVPAKKDMGIVLWKDTDDEENEYAEVLGKLSTKEIFIAPTMYRISSYREYKKYLNFLRRMYIIMNTIEESECIYE